MYHPMSGRAPALFDVPMADDGPDPMAMDSVVDGHRNVLLTDGVRCSRLRAVS